MLLDSLKFVKRAVSKVDLIPALKHFHIKDRCIQGSNGVITMSSPIPLDINCSPHGETFANAVDKSGENIVLSFNGKLKVSSGRFRVNIDCLPDDIRVDAPQGNFYEIDGKNLLECLKALQLFIGEDPSKLWTNGILFDNGYAFATNNVILAEYNLGSQFPIKCNIPKIAIKELIKINEPVTNIQACEQSVTFHFEGGRWLKTALYSNDWPEFKKYLPEGKEPGEIDKEFFESVSSIEPFLNDLKVVYFDNGVISTSDGEEDGARFEADFIDFNGCYNYDKLMSLRKVVTHMDLSGTPGYFEGENLRGVIVGMRHNG